LQRNLIEKFKESDDVSQYFILQKKDILTAKNGSKYINFTFSDKSGIIDGKIWDVKDNTFADIEIGEIVFVHGKVVKFKSNLQLNVELIEKRKLENSDLIDSLIPSTPKNIEEMIGKISVFIDSINDHDIRKLVSKIIFDEEILPLFKSAPAASRNHHAYRGGLLEHTLSVISLSDTLASSYSKANRDLLISGATLHDIGKIYEYDLFTFQKTDKGRLLGHIPIGIEMIDDKIRRNKFTSDKLFIHLKHIVVSHHGELQWGSPVQPATLEAILIHFADNIDSKAQIFSEFKIDDNSGWIYSKSLGRDVMLNESNLTDKSKNVKTIFGS